MQRGEIQDAFDVVVFVYVDADVRLKRLRQREICRYEAANPEFLAWVAKYDFGTALGRTLAKHRAWLEARSYPVIHIQGAKSVAEKIEIFKRRGRAKRAI